MKLIYCHEHVTVDLSHEKNDPDCRLRDFEATLAEFRRLRELGVRAIMDQTNRGMGRDPEYVHRMAQESGLEIQLATGFYKEPFLPPEVYEMTERQLCTLMVDEIERGIGNSGLRAQHIGEVGSGFKGISPMEEKVLRAAARTQRETGVPLVTHASLGAFAPEQWKIFSAYGVPAEKVVISHVPLAHDEAYMLRVADLGVNLSFDTVGKEKYQPIEEALRFLTLLRDKGHLSQVMLSMDLTRRSHLMENGGPGYAFLITDFLPMAAKNGFSQEELTCMVWDNPARVFGVKEETT